jgi:DNA-binding IclR family transcriptional regulator
MSEPAIIGAQTLIRGLAVLQAVADGANSLPRIGQSIGCTRSTTQRLVSALVERRFLRNGPDHGYALGSKLIELGFRARETVPVTALARRFIAALAARTQDTVHLGVADGAEVLYIDKIPGQRGLEMRSRVGHRMKLAVTGVGKALMLDMTPEQRHALHADALAHSGARSGLHPWPVYDAELRAYAASGVAFDLAENEIGIHCVAAPVRDAGGSIVAAISVASAAQHMPEARMRALAPDVAETAEAISMELGWAGPSAKQNQ